MKAANATASFVLALFLALTAAWGIAAAVEATPPSLMSRENRLAALDAIERDGRLALASCREVVDDADRSLCRAEARARRKIARATLEARYLGTVGAQQGLEFVQQRAAHSVGCARRLLHS